MMRFGKMDKTEAATPAVHNESVRVA